MFHKINLLFWLFLFSTGMVAAQNSAVKLTPEEEQAYKAQVAQMMEYLQGTLNFLGDPSNPPAEKEIIINESYLKIFQNDKVQIEGDLDEHRLVPLHKDVQAYLKDVVFFFKKVNFKFHINNIQPLLTPNGQMYFKVILNRTLNGITVDGDTVENNQLRYVEINLDPEKNSLKIASIYTNKPNDDREVQYWWNHLSPAWRDYFGKAIRVYDTIPLNKILSFSDSTLVVEVEKTVTADSSHFTADSAVLSPADHDSLALNDTVRIPDTLKIANSSLMVQLVRHLREAREVDISGNLDIENLQPLGEMDNLRSLNCAHTLIEDLTPLRTLSHLQFLDITGCPVSSLEPLRYVSALREIDAAYTSVKNGDVLAGLKNLEILNLSHTLLDTVPNLADLSHLHTLELDAAPIRTIDSLTHAGHLSNLSLARTPVTDFSPLGRLRSLQMLNLDSTRIVDLQPLASLDSLSILQINGTRVTDLLPLAHLPALKYIYCDNSGVNFKAAAAFNQINPRCQVIYNSRKLEQWWSGLPESWKNIFIRQAKLQQPVTKEQLHKVLLVKKLDLSGNKTIRSLKPLEILIQLTDLNVSGTSVSDFSPLASMHTLRRLDVSYTAARTLEPLKKLKNLQEIHLQHTLVSDLLPLAGNRNLKQVWADDTRVSRKNVRALREQLPQCLVIWQTSQLRLWWDNLEPVWQKALSQQTDLEIPPSPEQLQQLVNRKSLTINNHLDIDNVEPLTVFDDLETLRLDNTAVTDVTPLAGLKRLVSLSVTNSPLWDIGPLARMKQLKTLNLENTSVEDLSPLQGLHGLKKLNISGTKVKNLKPLSGLTNLHELVLNNTRVSSLKYVMPLSHLTLLRCDHTFLRPKKVDAFKKNHPKTKVIFY
jgi:hypothetical protein